MQNSPTTAGGKHLRAGTGSRDGSGCTARAAGTALGPTRKARLQQAMPSQRDKIPPPQADGEGSEEALRWLLDAEPGAGSCWC